MPASLLSTKMHSQRMRSVRSLPSRLHSPMLVLDLTGTKLSVLAARADNVADDSGRGEPQPFTESSHRSMDVIRTKCSTKSLTRGCRVGRRISLLLRRGRKPKTELESPDYDRLGSIRCGVAVAPEHALRSPATWINRWLQAPQVSQIDLSWVPLLTALLPRDGSNESGSVDATSSLLGGETVKRHSWVRSKYVRSKVDAVIVGQRKTRQ